MDAILVASKVKAKATNIQNILKMRNLVQISFKKVIEILIRVSK